LAPSESLGKVEAAEESSELGRWALLCANVQKARVGWDKQKVDNIEGPYNVRDAGKPD
jgi:hypothetical protein